MIANCCGGHWNLQIDQLVIVLKDCFSLNEVSNYSELKIIMSNLYALIRICKRPVIFYR